MSVVAEEALGLQSTENYMTNVIARKPNVIAALCFLSTYKLFMGVLITHKLQSPLFLFLYPTKAYYTHHFVAHNISILVPLSEAIKV